MAKAILVSPVFDDVTQYSHSWSREVKDLLQDRGYEVIDLAGRRVRRGEVETALKENPGALYVFYNHGSYDALWGSTREAVTDIFNADLLSGRPVYTMACQSAKRLGYEARRRMCEAYWGEDETFNFTTDSLDEFRQFANCGLRFWFETGSWRDSLKKARALGRELVDKLIGAGKLLASSCMDWNVSHLHCWDGEEPPRPCLARLVTSKVLGPVAWRIPRAMGIGILVQLLGLGILIHDYGHTLWEVGGYPEILSPQGGWVGATLAIAGFLLLTGKYIKWLSTRAG